MEKKTRKMIRIDEEKCDGCGDCITACAEGALALVNGKAKVVSEKFCDGMGDCIGTCPQGALVIETIEAEDYDSKAALNHVATERGEEGVKRFLEAEKKHTQTVKPAQPSFSGCPGRAQKSMSKPGSTPTPTSRSMGAQAIRSELEQWPIQLHLVRPDSPFFKGRELVVLSTCSPVASPDVNWRFVRGRSVVVACPKLDRTEGYVEKLAQIVSEPTIPKVLIVRMEVPCCGGLTVIAREAVVASGRKDLILEEINLSLQGEVLSVYGITV